MERYCATGQSPQRSVVSVEEEEEEEEEEEKEEEEEEEGKPPDAQYLKFILFWNKTLHVSNGLSVHHQESQTVHTASGICHTGSVAAC